MPGQQIDSVNRLMQRHKVSRETAKLVLKMLMADNLVVSKAGKGSFVNINTITNGVWAMIIPFYSSNMEMLISQLDAEAIKRGKKFTYFFHYNNPEEEMHLVGSLINSGYEALLVVPNYDETLTAEFYRKLKTGATFLLLVDNTMAGSLFKYVVQSYDLGVKRALDYLVSKTPFNLLFVKNNSWKGRNLLYELMEQTFSNIVSANYPNRQVFVVSNFNELDNKFFADNIIGGVLTCVDTDALRLLGRLKAWNINVPEKVTLVNYGNTELTKVVEPFITVIDCMYAEMAQKAAALIDKGAMAGPYEQIVVQPQLIVRET